MFISSRADICDPQLSSFDTLAALTGDYGRCKQSYLVPPATSKELLILEGEPTTTHSELLLGQSNDDGPTYLAHGNLLMVWLVL